MFTLAAELRHTMSLLESALAALNREILRQAGDLPVATCYCLPEVALGKEHEPVEHIQVQAQLTGRPALDAALSAFGRWHLKADCSAKASFRLPGFILLPGASRALLEQQVAEVNRLKLAFRTLVQQLDDKDKKFTLVHHTFPGLITLQVYRQLTLLPHTASRLGFTWANKQIIQKVDKARLVEQLMQSRHSPPPLTDAHTWQQCVDREIYDVKRLPAHVELRLRRPVKTHPMVNVRWSEPLTPRQQQFKAHLPLLLCQDELPAITHLGDYPPAKARKQRAARIGGEPLIPRLHIYPFEP
ncbi:DNA replication terminus site-binding protein [Oceanimonas sp. GK1]|uniref:DNA replication terminus site-binding protein n=1 Tax=Oceanimonas sp. (strain GK1 / IBRC-M 10197) TaxID=511062 RepID=UPI000249519D|nr:DNA replication terminus site-binding protein [Oceanimonas sp. GK1]AEY01841.1 DNA replication terminus site-binding protein [Oceanimonas sp. GK1]